MIDLSLSTPGTYTVTNTIAVSGGCPSATATTNVTINAPQTAAFSYIASPYCQNGTNPSPSIGSGSVAGVFSSTSGLSVNSSTGVVNLASSVAGTYTVTNTLTASGGCPAVTATTNITISPLQNAAFSYSAASFCQTGANASPVITGVSGGTFTSSPSGLSMNSATGQINVSASTVNTYTVTYTTAGPCANSSNVSVSINAAPVATAGTTSSPVCAGQPVNFTSSGGGTYSWSGPASYSSSVQNASISSAVVSNSGTYTVTVSNGGCSSSATVNLVVNALPSVSAGNDTTITLGSAATLSASGATNYSWTPATGLSCSNCANPVANPSSTTTYCVTGSTGSCADNDCITVKVDVPCITNSDLGVPNAFSPNNDGVNDNFCLQGWSACMNEFSILIYDRWGEKVFESSAADFCWDGTFRGRTLDPAVFVYFINAAYFTGDKVSKKGNISIIR
jgi:gliding motility-associated-like protein